MMKFFMLVGFLGIMISAVLGDGVLVENEFQETYLSIKENLEMVDAFSYNSVDELCLLWEQWGSGGINGINLEYGNYLYHAGGIDRRIYLLGMKILFLKKSCEIERNTKFKIDFTIYLNGPKPTEEQLYKIKWNNQVLPKMAKAKSVSGWEMATLEGDRENCEIWLKPLVFLLMENDYQLKDGFDWIEQWKNQERILDIIVSNAITEFQHKYFNLKNRLNALDPSDSGVAASLNSLNQEWEELFSQYQASLETPENNKRSRIYQLGMRLLFLKRTLVLAGDPAEEIARLRMILDILEPTNEACEEWAIPLICLLMDNEVQINAAMQAVRGWKADHGLQEEESSTKSAVSAGKE